MLYGYIQGVQATTSIILRRGLGKKLGKIRKQNVSNNIIDGYYVHYKETYNMLIW